MPPQARSISSYFKPSTTPVKAATASPSSTAKTGPFAPGSAAAISSTATAGAKPASSSPITPSKRSTLSEAAKRAIREAAGELDNGTVVNEDGGSEPAAKKAKIDGSPSSAKVADIFAKPTSSLTPSKGLATATRFKSRDELRAKIAENPKWMSALQLEIDTMGEDWLLALQDELTKGYFLSLKDFITTEQRTKKVFPPAQDIYSWSRLCPLKDIRVVIIGQDPYHDDGQAHGLAFSVRKGVRIPPSLRNIYKEMHDEYPDFAIPNHGDLTEWAKHGVLLLNTSLTVRAHEAGSHANKGWDQFTAAKENEIGLGHVAGGKGVVFMAWGAHAAKMCAGVDQKKHLILKSAHPSPLSASRGFLGNNHFKKANEWLVQRYGVGGGIDWRSLGAGAGADGA
ncbi:uracil-DNA glycosylase [Kwoniella heveanensis BCC8398]|uniref:Uracil-DNA glycosylase n=1 Tax=Kwoniella heveanensis BCC8398 TaxID=1296120 RepID=A0A1B9GLM9_9TREE|nr:uracil-DNA glycosylase [Kwoniella heveanensis BCC8398]